MARVLLAAVGLAALATAVFLAQAAFFIARQSRVDETRPAGAIVVFGAAEYSGHPSPVYRARLDHALELFDANIAPIVISTGGAGSDPQHTEGTVGRDYLIAHGVPDRNLIAETQSNDTADSAQRVAAILRANRVRDCVAVSDAYHMFRIKRLMQAQGIAAYASPRPGSIPRTRTARLLGILREAFSYLLWKLNLT